MAAIERDPAPRAATIERGAERAARATLRDQIARLERELATVITAACPRLDPGPPLPSLAGPRLLSLGELERVRDALAGRLSTLRAAAAAQSARQADAARELERMLADPPAHKWLRLSNADLGLPGCTTYHVRPRAGLLGMLMGWWQVKVSRRLPVTRLTDERPKAPWHPFPLVELCVLAGIVLIVLGLLSFDSDRGRAMLLCGMALGSLGGFDTAAREHFAGYQLALDDAGRGPGGRPGGDPLLRRGPVAGGRRRRADRVRRAPSRCSRARTSGARADRDSTTLPAVTEQKRMQLRGLHHLTAISGDLDRTIAFYRDLLGLAIVHDGPSDDDPTTRHVWFGALDGGAGHAAQLHAVPGPAEGRGGDRVDASLRARRGLRRGTGGVARLPARAGRRVHRRLRPRGVPLDLHPRSRRAHRRDRHPRARASPAPAASAA